MVGRASFLFFVGRKKLKRHLRSVLEWLTKQPWAQSLARWSARNSRHYHPIIIYILMDNITYNRNLLGEYICRTYKKILTEKLLSHALKTAAFISDRKLVIDIAKFAQNQKIPLTNVANRWFSLSDGRFSDYLKQLNGCKYSRRLYRVFPEQMVMNNDVNHVLRNSKRKLILSTLGPGDEIACSAAYNALIRDQNVDNNKISIVCDRRFTNIFRRSFPELIFIPTTRKRYLEFYDYDITHKLPDISVHSILCSSAYESAQKYPHWLTMMQLVSHYKEYILGDSNRAQIKADPHLVELFSKRLSPYRRKLLVGLTWRGAISTVSRLATYLTIEEMEELFSIDDVTFVNLQYGDTRKETSWVNRRYPGKLVTIDNLDVYNDFDSLLATIANLDLCIGPATFNTKFSALAGCKTIFIALTLGATARRMPDGSDIWSRNLIHVQGGVENNRKNIVKELTRIIKSNVNN